jgi:hypothetical protein
MVQHMPKASPFADGGGSGENGLLSAIGHRVDGDDAENWNRINMLLDTVEELELVGPSGASDRPSRAALSRGAAARLRAAGGRLRLHLLGGSRAAQPVDLFGQGHRAR